MLLKKNDNCPRAFTLVELLVVIAIIGILIALLIPAVQAAREAARRMQCSNNLKQLMLGFHGYHDAHGTLPPEAWLNFKNNKSQGLGIMVRVLPYLEKAGVFSRIDFDNPYEEDEGTGTYEGNETLAKELITAMHCPSCSELYSSMSQYGQELHCFTSHYYGITGAVGMNARTQRAYSLIRTREANGGDFGGGPNANNGVFFENSCISFAKVVDGLTNTFALGEIAHNEYRGYFAWVRGAYANPINEAIIYVSSKNVEWELNKICNPEDPNAALYRQFYSTGSFSSHHASGVNFALCDGSVQFVHDNVALSILLAYSSRKGRESVMLP